MTAYNGAVNNITVNSAQDEQYEKPAPQIKISGLLFPRTTP